MRAIDAIKTAANESGIPIGHIGTELGKARTYVNTMASKGSTPNVNTMAAMLRVCGYGLYAIPDNETIPETAIHIDTVE